MSNEKRSSFSLLFAATSHKRHCSSLKKDSFPPQNPPEPPGNAACVPQGKGDMVTYWLDGKKTSVTGKDSSPDDAKRIAMDTEREERELYASMPGFLNHDLLLDAV